MTTLLIDADGLVFKVAAAVQKDILWDDDIYTSHADLNEAKDGFIYSLESIRAAVGGDPSVVLCFSCPTRRYFRHEIFPEYKSNRSGSKPPLALRGLREWASETYNTKTKPGLEADDVLGILATHPTLIKGRKIIVSPDKDLRQVPGFLLNPNDLDAGIQRTTIEEAEANLWVQVLTGDSTDGYPGCPGIGPVKATKILATSAPEAWPFTVAEAYKKAGQTPEQFETQVNVARILQSHSYNFKTKAPIVWRMSTQP